MDTSDYQTETSVPIIVITADADAATCKACFDAGINAVLAKPVIPEELDRPLPHSAEGP
jgi:CheY-like chemotaxis protein